MHVCKSVYMCIKIAVLLSFCYVFSKKIYLAILISYVAETKISMWLFKYWISNKGTHQVGIPNKRTNIF